MFLPKVSLGQRQVRVQIIASHLGKGRCPMQSSLPYRVCIAGVDGGCQVGGQSCAIEPAAQSGTEQVRQSTRKGCVDIVHRKGMMNV
jgi:hypothetical protein